ncbi:MAG: 30S ribosomal protein S16 [Candidatus Hodgkinia cicadicola]
MFALIPPYVRLFPTDDRGPHGPNMPKIRLIPAPNAFRIAVMDSRRKRTGVALDRIGFVQISPLRTRVSLDIFALRTWLRSGALPTKPLIKLLSNLIHLN